ncbi:MAG: replicative DNA helicase [bacterium]
MPRKENSAGNGNVAPPDQIIDRLPPQDANAEVAVLGAMLQESNAASRAFELLEDWCFYKGGHQHVFQAMSGLFERNEPLDVLTVGAELQRRGQLDAIGGNYYLTELVARVPSAANVEYHARIVLEKALLRRLIGVATEIATEAFEEQDRVDDILDKAEQRIFSLSERRLRRGFEFINPILHKTFDTIESYHHRRGSVTGVASGFNDLDEMTSGFQNSDLIIVAGRPSMGKTAFCLNMARNAAVDHKIGVGIFSLEMANYQLALRLLCSEARVNSHAVRTGKLPREQFSKLALAVGKLAEAPIYIDDTPALTVMEIRAKARRLVAEKKVGLFIVDYLQLVRGPRSVESRQIEISMISQSLKALAKELDVPVIALSQLSRAVEQRGGDRRPILSDLRESGAIEQDADVVLFIYRPEVYDRVEFEGISEIIIGKQRNGPTGTVKVVFLKDYVLFANLEKGRSDSPAMESSPF